MQNVVADVVMDYNEAVNEACPAEEQQSALTSELLRPLLRDSLAPAAAAVAIQAAWRSRLARSGLTPSAVARVTRRRAAVALQRAFRTHLVSATPAAEWSSGGLNILLV